MIFFLGNASQGSASEICPESQYRPWREPGTIAMGPRGALFPLMPPTFLSYPETLPNKLFPAFHRVTLFQNTLPPPRWINPTIWKPAFSAELAGVVGRGSQRKSLLRAPSWLVASWGLWHGLATSRSVTAQGTEAAEPAQRSPATPPAPRPPGGTIPPRKLRKLRPPDAKC